MHNTRFWHLKIKFGYEEFYRTEFKLSISKLCIIQICINICKNIFNSIISDKLFFQSLRLKKKKFQQIILKKIMKLTNTFFSGQFCFLTSSHQIQTYLYTLKESNGLLLFDIFTVVCQFNVQRLLVQSNTEKLLDYGTVRGVYRGLWRLNVVPKVCYKLQTK